MNKRTFIAAASPFALASVFITGRVSGEQSAQGHVEWVAQSLREMQGVKVGMTRADLLKVFTTEGGLSTDLRRTYVYRGCPYIKVDVEFEPVGRPARDAEGRVTLVEGARDTVKRISRPYLDWTVAD